jgi:bifunctional UDP-N-acetylglucosamine pyrophosphorylase/glucosamine-1-phosphate N-acetyltransferase
MRWWGPGERGRGGHHLQLRRVQKQTTTIGPGAFIGSNVNLVAPVRVGAGAVVGAGSTLDERCAGGRAWRWNGRPRGDQARLGQKKTAEKTRKTHG